MVVFGLILLAGLICLPQLWIWHTLSKYGHQRDDYPGTGAELARHLLEQFDLQNVVVESTDIGDHYDPSDKAVRLSPDHYSGKSLTAVAVAAHEVSHAIQDARNENPFLWSQTMRRWAMASDRVASIFFLLSPFAGLVFRSPAAMLGVVLIGVALLSIRVLTMLASLPVEFDASFSKALPILKHGQYLNEDDLKGARHVLRAAAFTYVAGAMMAMVNVARWLRILR